MDKDTMFRGVMLSIGTPALVEIMIALPWNTYWWQLRHPFKIQRMFLD